MATSNWPRCLVAGCRRRRNPKQVTCVQHWWQVPRTLREAVWQTYHDGDRRARTVAVRRVLEYLQEGGTDATAGN